MKNTFIALIALISTAPLSAGTGPTEKKKAFLRLIEQERIAQDASCPPSEADEILEFDKIALDEKRTKLLEILAREAEKQPAGAYVYHDLHEHFHDKAMTRGDLELFVFDFDAEEPRIPKIIHNLDSHAHFSILPPLPYFLPMENRIALAAEIITALQSSKNDTAKSAASSKMPKIEDVD
jgi:hypothetical protein